ncbi:MAG: putative Ig domain-containing protein, partial [Bryobacteraceae bacterium]
MIKLTEKLEGGALMRGIAVVGLALLAAASLPAASVAIGQLQLTNNNGYQALTFYNFTGSGNGGCDGVEYKVCNGVTINSWTLTLTYTNTGNSSPTNAPPASTVTFTSGGSNVIAPYSGSGPGYTGSLAGTWEIPLTGVGGTEPACPPCDYQLTQIELSGTINPANIPFTVGSPGNTSQFGANPNFDAIWVVQSDSTKPGFVDYSNPQFFGGAYDVTVNDQQPPPAISTSANGTYTTGTQQIPLQASGGNGTYAWSLASGSLPAGLALRTDVPSNFSSNQQAGLIGVATTPGTYNFTLNVTSAGQTVSQAFTVKITALNIKDLGNLPDAFANTAYSYSFTALNPAGTANFTVGGIPLPTGMLLSSTGVLSGTPTVPGQYIIPIFLADGTDTISRGFNLTVSAVAITTAGLLPNGTQGSAYNQTLSASGGSGGYTFSVTGGGFPNGLSLSSGGTISGTIGAFPGRYGFGVTATDSSSNFYTKQMVIDVLDVSPRLPEISLQHVDGGVVGDTESFSVGMCCGAVAPFTWGVTGLPTGMSFRFGSGNTSSWVTPGDVEIWGIPQAVGNYTVQLTSTDATSAATSVSFTYHVSQLDQNPQLPNGTLNTAYSAPLRVLGGTGPYTVSKVGGTLPDGLTLNAGAMQVSGTPLENGGFGPVLRFTDSANPSHTLVRTNPLNINNVNNLAGSGININANSNLGTVTGGNAYSNQLSACCVASYTWSVTGGALPNGITLSAGGLLSGTPTAAGTYTFLIEAADAASVASPGFRQFTLIVTPISIVTNGLPYGNLSAAYSQTLAATGGTGTLTWTLNADNYLPPGLSLSSGGVISGTPTSTGQYNVNVTVTDGSGNTATRGYNLNIYPVGGGPPLSISTAANLILTTGTSQLALDASGGTGTYTWSLSSGTLPTGLALRTDVPSFFFASQQAGLIGVATTPGTYNFTLNVVSGIQNTSRAFTVKITALNVMDSSTLPDAFANTAYSYSFTALNPAATATFTATGNPLPAGLSLSTAGVLSGTPTAAGNYNFGVNLTDGTDTISRGFNLTVSAVGITTGGLLPNGTQGSAYNQTLSASGGSGGYTFNVSGGSLPFGLSLSSGGTISGTINAGPGQYAFGVQATDSSHSSYTKQMSIDVLGVPPVMPEISLGHVDDGVMGDPDSFSVGVCCGGTAPFAWGVTGLPTGMSFRSGAGNTGSTVTPGDVEIWGIPQAAGDYTVQLTATDANSAATSQSFSFHVSQIDQNPQIPGGTLNTAYSAPLRVLGGTGPYAVTQVGGTFPDGLTLNAGAMQVSGTPLENGNFGPVLKFTDSASPSHTLVRTDGLNINNVAG